MERRARADADVEDAADEAAARVPTLAGGAARPPRPERWRGR